MHVAFAITFFLYVALSETLRHGVFGLNPYEITGILTGVLIGAALLFLRGDVAYLFRAPQDELYGARVATWSWQRTILGLFLSPLLLVAPLIYGIAMIQINFREFDAGFLTETLVAQALFVALASELFFRETVIKAFRGQIGAIVLASSIAWFTFWVPSGVETALIATGSGLFFLSLRLIGTNILAVTLIHAGYALLWGHVLSLGQTAMPDMQFAVYYLGSAAVVAGVICYLFAETEYEYLHA